MIDPSLCAFIPARAGSRRIPSKNIRPFIGHPLLAYAIHGAMEADLFDEIYVSSDSDEIGRIAKYYGAEFIKRPEEYATDTSPDAEWIAHALEQSRPQYKAYAILRPTNPFRSAETIRRAFMSWDRRSHMKAVEPVHEHPGKMWIVRGERMEPLWPGDGHLNQTNTLPRLYVQNASLELRVRGEMQTFQPFLTDGWEGFDLNTPDDWMLAESLVEHNMAIPPKIGRRAYV